MNLDITGVTPPNTTPDYVLEHCAFDLGPPLHLEQNSLSHNHLLPWEDFAQHLFVNISATTFTSHVLRYRYTIGRREEWMTVGDTLEYQTLAQMFKLKQSKRDELVEEGGITDVTRMFLYLESFEEPDRWDYFDDHYIALVERTLTSQRRKLRRET